jgi:hypothetical protein
VDPRRLSTKYPAPAPIATHNPIVMPNAVKPRAPPNFPSPLPPSTLCTKNILNLMIGHVNRELVLYLHVCDARSRRYLAVRLRAVMPSPIHQILARRDGPPGRLRRSRRAGVSPADHPPPTPRRPAGPSPPFAWGGRLARRPSAANTETARRAVSAVRVGQASRPPTIRRQHRDRPPTRLRRSRGAGVSPADRPPPTPRQAAGPSPPFAWGRRLARRPSATNTETARRPVSAVRVGRASRPPAVRRQPPRRAANTETARRAVSTP